MVSYNILWKKSGENNLRNIPHHIGSDETVKYVRNRDDGYRYKK